MFLVLFCYYLNQNNRAAKKKDPKHSITTYGMNTGTGTVRTHFSTFHDKEWVEECKKQGITIKSANALKALAAHHGDISNSEGPSRSQYTVELFVDALTDFIVATDQVYCFSLFLSFILN
jgi:hypothetical protein